MVTRDALPPPTADTGVTRAAPPASPESCPDCGFVWSSVPDAEIGRRMCDGSDALATVLRTTADAAARARPAPDVWSALEYGAHVRDVLLHLRDRVVIGLAEDTPAFKPLYRDLRVDAGLYRDDPPGVVATELEVASDLFARTFAQLDEEQLARPVLYAFPVERERTIRWMGQQAVHEVEHHLADARRGLER
jgi:hypothetical protein